MLGWGLHFLWNLRQCFIFSVSWQALMNFTRENWYTEISCGLLIKLSCLFAWPDFHIVGFVKSLGFTAELVYWENCWVFLLIRTAAELLGRPLILQRKSFVFAGFWFVGDDLWFVLGGALNRFRIHWIAICAVIWLRFVWEIYNSHSYTLNTYLQRFVIQILCIDLMRNL